jgi:hypothetical protein
MIRDFKNSARKSSRAVSKRTQAHAANRWPVAMRTFNFMKQFFVFATLGVASGHSVPSR